MGTNSAKCKFVNRNPFPIYLPDSHGGSRLFVPGEWGDNPWWSRFLGPAQLTREPLTEADKHLRKGLSVKLKGSTKRRSHVQFVPYRRRHPANRRAVINNKSACASSCMIACEMSTQEVTSDENWVTIGGTHFCKHCDWSTEDENLVKMHFDSYHRAVEEDQGDVDSKQHRA